MRSKLAFVLGAAVGYVLGTRAGRERYEQIKRGAQRLWETDPVQNGVHIVKEMVDDRADDLKGFAIRVGNDVFSNLAGTRQKSDPFTTTDEAEAEKRSAGSTSGARSSAGGSKSARSSNASASRSSSKSKSKSQPKSKSSGGKAKS